MSTQNGTKGTGIPEGVRAFTEQQLQRIRWSSKINPGRFHLYGLRYGFPRLIYSAADLEPVQRAAEGESRPWAIARDGDVLHVAGHIPPFVDGDSAA